MTARETVGRAGKGQDGRARTREATAAGSWCSARAPPCQPVPHDRGSGVSANGGLYLNG